MLPPSIWRIGDLAARRLTLPGYFRLHVEHALAHGVVDTTPDRSAAALLLPGDGRLPAADYPLAGRRSARWPSMRR
jgi:hypothetical protein